MRNESNTQKSVSYWMEGNVILHLLLQLSLAAVCQTFLPNPDTVTRRDL